MRARLDSSDPDWAANSDDSFRVFTQHHAVFRDNTQTMRLRVIFNASLPISSKVSIKNCLHLGKNSTMTFLLFYYNGVNISMFFTRI